MQDTSAATLPAAQSPSQDDWNERLERLRLQYRQDPTTWDQNLLKKDLEQVANDEPMKPITFGAFPVPRYDLIGSARFKGVSNGGNFSGIDYFGKKIVYAYLGANRTSIRRDFVKDKPDGVFFTIVMLTDFIDQERYSHAGLNVSSRNTPDYLGAGFIKTSDNQVDFVAFDTAGGDAFAVVNLRLFNLRYGRTILIAPQDDLTIRSMQIVSPEMAADEATDYVNRLLERGDVKAFFSGASKGATKAPGSYSSPRS
ncbi:MAG: hypothetical protein ACRCT8_08455 [Lacipirellulaceae bacterium]